MEHLCELPANLAKTELVVRPCVALLHSYNADTGESADPEVSLIPKLDAREVAVVFTAPFYNFLRKTDGESGPGVSEGSRGVLDDDPGQWYRGSWSLWHNSNWRSKFSNFFLFEFHIPVFRQSPPLSSFFIPICTHGKGCGSLSNQDDPTSCLLPSERRLEGVSCTNHVVQVDQSHGELAFWLFFFFFTSRLKEG